MPGLPHDPAALAKAVPAHLLGAALGGGIVHTYLTLPGRPDDDPELAPVRDAEAAEQSRREAVLGDLANTVAAPDRDGWWDE